MRFGMSRAAVALFLALFTFQISKSFAATGRVECNAVPSKILLRPVKYCIILPPSYDADKLRRFPILYFLHGLGDSEQSFINTGAWNVTQELTERGQIREFLIATPEGDASFYINSRDGKVRYEDFFIQEFVPFIEKRYRAAGHTSACCEDAGESARREVCECSDCSESRDYRD